MFNSLFSTYINETFHRAGQAEFIMHVWTILHSIFFTSAKPL